MSTSVALSGENFQLNRYNNVFPNDQHRVILESFNDRDYINASIVRSSSDSVESGQFYILGKSTMVGYKYNTNRTIPTRQIQDINGTIPD